MACTKCEVKYIITLFFTANYLVDITIFDPFKSRPPRHGAADRRRVICDPTYARRIKKQLSATLEEIKSQGSL
jgi:hypothetical protein